MHWYVIIVYEDGASQHLQFMSQGNAAETFNRACGQPSVVYAHYAELFCDRTNWYCRHS